MESKSKIDRVLDVLMSNTLVEGRYLGGNEEPIISILNSEGVGYSADERRDALKYLAKEIVESLEPTK